MAASRSTFPLMKYLRVRVDALPRNTPLTLAPNFLIRRFCEEVRGCFLDKSEVTDRVISCVKNFQKVDPSKVNSISFPFTSVCFSLRLNLFLDRVIFSIATNPRIAVLSLTVTLLVMLN